MNTTIRWTGLALIGSAALAAWWWGTDSASPSPARDAVAKAPAQAAPAASSAVDADRSVVVDGGQDAPRLDASFPAAASVAAGDSAVWLAAAATDRRRPAETIEWEIRQLAGQKDQRLRVRNALKELAAKDSEESRGILLALLEDLSLRFPGKEEGIARALLDSGDERIFPVALRTGAALVEGGEWNGTGLRAVLRLVAIHGDGEGADFVVSLLHHSEGSLRAIAASLIADLDRSCGPALATIARSESPIAAQVRYGLVQWREIAGQRELLSIAHDETVAAATREACLRGLAQTAPVDLLPELSVSFWNDGDPQSRRLALHALSAMERNEQLDPLSHESLALPILAAAIVDPDPELRQRAFELLERAPFPRSVRRPLIQAALGLESDPDLLQRLAQWLEEQAAG